MLSTTGGTALPADYSPQSAPGTPDQPGGAGGSAGNDAEGAGQWPAGQPRPFFADEQGQQDQSRQQDQPGPRDQAGRPGEPSRPGLVGSPYGQPTSLGPRYGWPAQPGQDGTGRPGDQQSGWRPVDQEPQRPQRQAQRPARPPERELRQRAIASLVFGAIALIALSGLGTDLHKGVYLLIFSAAVGIAALVIGITALVKARKTGSYRPRGAVGGIVLGAIATFIAVPFLAFYLVFPTQFSNYFNCGRQAQNSSDQRACLNKFRQSIHLGAAPAAGVTRAERTGLAGASGSPARLPTGR